MPPNDDKSSITRSSDKDVHDSDTPFEHRLTMLFQKIAGNDGLMTEAHVDEYLSQRREVHKYIHEEQMQEHERFKISSQDHRFYFAIATAFVVLIAGAVLFFQPDLFSEVLFALLGFLGGFGLGKNPRFNARDRT
jgi:hypothetical protein